MQQELLDALNSAILREQHPSGCFLNLQSPQINDFSLAQPEETTFVTSQILRTAGDQLPTESRNKAADFLKKQIHPKTATINYWPRGSHASRLKPYPDDWDDTACGWLALSSVSSALNGDDLARLTAALIACESEAGGPYRTWLVSETADLVWRDIDVAVNANIASFLASQDVHLASLDRYLDQMIDSGAFSSPYYPDAIPVLYFLTHARFEIKREALIRAWLSLKHMNGWGDAMRTAMAISSLKKLQAPANVYEQEETAWLARPDLMMQPYAFCLDPAEQGKATYAGSAGLTAAFAIEVLKKQTTLKQQKIHDLSDEIAAHEEIMSSAMRLVSISQLQTSAEEFLQALSVKDTRRQITLTPYRLAMALGRIDARDMAVKAGAGSLFGWSAYTLYDDVWDGDATASVLPLANLFHRRMFEVFTGIASDRSFQRWWLGLIDQVDAANAWELAYCRIPIAHGRIRLPDARPVGLEEALIGRSIGHVIGPGAVLLACGWSVEQPAFLSLIEVYRAYILARQLHDDAHDWETDLKRGQLNAASFAILDLWQGPREVSLETFLPKARELFWMQIIPAYTEQIVRICEEAKIAISRISDIKHPEILSAMFDTPLNGAKQALNERERTMAFLKTFPS